MIDLIRILSSRFKLLLLMSGIASAIAVFFFWLGYALASGQYQFFNIFDWLIPIAQTTQNWGQVNLDIVNFYSNSRIFEGIALTTATSGLVARASEIVRREISPPEAVFVSEVATDIPWTVNSNQQPYPFLTEGIHEQAQIGSKAELDETPENLLAKIKELKHEVERLKDLNHELTDTVRDLSQANRILAIGLEDEWTS